MNKLFFFLTLLSAGSVFAASNISGSIVKESTSYYLVADSGCVRYLIKPQNAETAQTMVKLRSGDQLRASGNLSANTCEATLHSIDFVGLQSLLGYWKSDDGMYSIRNFSMLQFFPEGSEEIVNGKYHDSIIPVTYHYSIVPAMGKDWVVFLSDNQDTQFATIRLNKNSATLKIFDSETGNMVSQKHLSKWSSIRK